METLLKQVNNDIEETTKPLDTLKLKLAGTKHSSTRRRLNLEIQIAKSMLADLLSSKAEIEDYIKTRSNDNA